MGEQQYFLLSQSFLHGVLYFQALPSHLGDTIFWQGHYFWPNPPLPVLLFVPFSLLSRLIPLPFIPGLVQVLCVMAVFASLYALSRRLHFSRIDSSYLAFAFCFATNFLGVAAIPWSWYFAHVLVVLFIILALLESLGKNRPWIIGNIFSFILATRYTAAIGLLYFVFRIPKNRLFQLLLPPFIAGLLLLAYNYARFGTVLDLGYLQNNLPSLYSASRLSGFFSSSHLLPNILLFLKSVIFTSPMLIALFFLPFKHPLSRHLLFVSAVVALPAFFYFSLGGSQFGYRYALDFYPYLFMLLLLNYCPPLSKKFKGLILLSSLANVYQLFLFISQFIRLE